MEARNKTIGILITDRCSESCAMCCFGCSPEKQNVIDESLLLEIIEQAAGIQGITAICNKKNRGKAPRNDQRTATE
jgi:MoaA/NifB/PqqE/SkfB family radical SAM enzyme